MAKCRFCGSRDVEVHLEYARLSLCVECFLKFFERKVDSTIRKYRMFPKGTRVAIAVSGGKDSNVLLYAVKKLYPALDLIPIYLNLGIKEYSDHCEELVREITRRLGLPLKVFRLEDEGFTLDDVATTRFRRKICTACGLIKRYWMNRLAYEMKAERLATGHNLDDLVKFALNHYIHGDLESILRLKPLLTSGMDGKLVAKVKPLCEVTDFEDLLYAEYSEIPYRSIDCPYATGKGYDRRQNLMKNILTVMPDFRHVFFKSHLKRFLPILEKGYELEMQLKECSVCGMPTIREVCAYCRLKEKLTNKD